MHAIEEKMERNLIEEQLREIFKDTKFLCNLQPFIQKWSFSEMLPNFELDHHPIYLGRDLSLIEFHHELENKAYSQDVKRDSHASMFRKLKGLFPSPNAKNDASNDSSNSLRLAESVDVNSIPLEDQYDHELQKTWKVFKETEKTEDGTLTQADIEAFIRDLGWKPDRVDLNEPDFQDWKQIFSGHCLDFKYTGSEKNLPSQSQTLPNIIACKSSDERDSGKSFAESRMLKKAACSSFRADQDNFLWTRGNRKNMVISINSCGLRDRTAKERKNDKVSLYSNSTSSSTCNISQARVQVPPRTCPPFSLPKEKSLLTLEKAERGTSVPHNTKEKRARSALIGGMLEQYKKLPIDDAKGYVEKFSGGINKCKKTRRCSNESGNDAELGTLNTDLKRNRNTTTPQAHCARLKIKHKATNRPSSASATCGNIV